MPSCPLGCCYGQENRRSDDSIPLPGSIPYTHRIRLGHHTLSPILANRSLPSWTNPCAVPYRRGCLRDARWPTSRSDEQEEASPYRYDPHHSSDRGNRFHKEPAECLCTSRSHGRLGGNGRSNISHAVGRCYPTDKPREEDGRFRPSEPRRIWAGLWGRVCSCHGIRV